MESGGVMDVIQQAANLRSAADSKERKLFDSWPEYLQNTLAATEAAKAAQESSIAARVRRSDALREQGSRMYARGEWANAYQLYVQAAGALRWVHCSSPDIRSTGIKDVYMSLRSSVPLLASVPPRPATKQEAMLVAAVLHKDASASAAAARLPSVEIEECGGDWEDISAEEAASARDSLVKAYCNASASLLAAGRYELAARAAADALRADPTCSKAYFRKASAIKAAPSAGTEELEAAVADLRAADILAPGDAVVARSLAQATTELRETRKRAKATFSGLFDRGAVVDEEEVQRARERRLKEEAEAKAKVERDEELRKEQGGAVGELLRTIDDLRKRGDHEAADELMERAAEVARMHAKDQFPQESAYIDWENPSDEMRESAAKFGIDLSNPDVVEELKEQDRLRAQDPDAFASTAHQAQAGSSEGEAGDITRSALRRAAEMRVRREARRGKEPSGGGGGGDEGGEEDMSEDDMLELVDRLPASDLRKLLSDHGDATAEEASGMELRELRERARDFVKRLSEAKRQGFPSDEGPPPWWITVAAVVLMLVVVAWRLSTSGTLSWLAETAGLGFRADSDAATATAAAAAGVQQPQAGAGVMGSWDDEADTVTADVLPDGTVRVVN